MTRYPPSALQQLFIHILAETPNTLLKMILLKNFIFKNEPLKIHSNFFLFQLVDAESAKWLRHKIVIS